MLKYDEDNPQIWEAFERLTFKMIKAGRTRYSAKTVFEVLRWFSDLRGDGPFKLNNNYTAYYSRKFMEKYPEYEGFFETRERSKT